MSTATAAPHDHAEHLAEESRRFHAFVNLALFMAMITGIELVIVFIPFPTWLVTSAIVILSVVKFAGVIFWFMHLIYDRPICTVVFLSALLIAGCTVAALLLLFTPDRVDLENMDPQLSHHAPAAGSTWG